MDPHIGMPRVFEAQSTATSTTTEVQIKTSTTSSKMKVVLDPVWKQQHDRMVWDAEHAPKELDIVMLGDSIIERWNGTKNMGNEVIPNMRNPFEHRFTRAGGGDWEGLALGCGGDTVRRAE